MRSSLPLRAFLALSILVARPAVAQVSDAKRADPPDPLLSEFLDTAAVRGALATRPAFSDPQRAARIVIVAFDSLGHPANVRPLLPQLMPTPERDTLLALVKAHLRPVAPRARGWETHLLLGAGPEARVEETAVTRRNAELADRTQLTRRLQREAQLLTGTQNALPPELTVRLRLDITADGLVDSITVLRSSGLAAADEAAIRVVRPSLFTPAVIEGHAVRTSVILPIRFVFPED